MSMVNFLQKTYKLRSFLSCFLLWSFTFTTTFFHRLFLWLSLTSGNRREKWISVDSHNVTAKNAIHIHFHKQQKCLRIETVGIWRCWQLLCIMHMEDGFGVFLASRLVLWELFGKLCCLFTEELSFVTRMNIDYELPCNKTPHTYTHTHNYRYKHEFTGKIT